MRKRGAVNNALKLRWCVLHGGVLYYYLRPETSRYQVRALGSEEGGGTPCEMQVRS